MPMHMTEERTCPAAPLPGCRYADDEDMSDDEDLRRTFWSDDGEVGQGMANGGLIAGPQVLAPALAWSCATSCSLVACRCLAAPHASRSRASR